MKNFIVSNLLSLSLALSLGACAGDDLSLPDPDDATEELAADEREIGVIDRCTRTYLECLHYASSPEDECLCDITYAECKGLPAPECF